jgi:hypothetical protein
MASQLSSIISAVAAMTITGYTMPVLRGSTLKNQTDDADVPTRIVNAIGVNSSRTRTATLGGAGHVMQAEWTIQDVALLRSAGIGQGLKDIALTVEGYLGAYHDALRQLIAPGWVLSNATVRATVLEWPQASGRYYDAVTATLTITEIIQ